MALKRQSVNPLNNPQTDFSAYRPPAGTEQVPWNVTTPVPDASAQNYAGYPEYMGAQTTVPAAPGYVPPEPAAQPRFQAPPTAQPVHPQEQEYQGQYRGSPSEQSPAPAYVQPQEALQPQAQTMIPAGQAGGALAAPTSGSLQEMGYAGLKLDFTSFPVITLPGEGRFKDSEERDMGMEFLCYIHRTMDQFVYRALTGGKVEDPKKDVVYSYDRQATTSGIPIADQIRMWEAQGKQVEEKQYVQALVLMHAPATEYDGDLRLLQIAPRSIGRLTGYLETLRLQGISLPSQLTRVFVGAKVIKAKHPFYPWAFAKAA